MQSTAAPLSRKTHTHGESLAEKLARKHRDFLTSLPPHELAALSRCWEFWARPEQLPPTWGWSTWVLCCGRAWGKTRTAAEWVRHKVQTGSRYIALVGPTAASVRDVMVEGRSGIVAVFPPNEVAYEPSKRRVTHRPTGAIMTTFPATEPDLLRGPENDAAWVDELASFEHLDETLSNLRMGLRGGTKASPPQMVITSTPRPIPVMRALYRDAESRANGVAWTNGWTEDNRSNLPDEYYRNIIAQYEGTRLGLQELRGEILDELEGALFRREWIQRQRGALPALSHVVVSVDPAITTRNDETGIVVVGRAGNKAYVLADESGVWTPDEWAHRAVELARKTWGGRRANCIVAEVNRGGDLVARTIRSFDKTISIREVRANKGKDTRAEPVAALYEQRRVWHVGEFTRLEEQMVTWDPTGQDVMRRQKQATSPDRLDALVWGITELKFHVGLARYTPMQMPKLFDA